MVVWDVRASSSLPVRRTALGGQSHSHPIYSMSSRRDHSGWSLVTASSDGLICEFDPRNLLEPTLRMPLSFGEKTPPSLPVSVSCLSMCSSLEEGLSDVALVGTESGDVFMAKIDASHTSALKKVRTPFVACICMCLLSTRMLSIKDDRGQLSESDRLGEGHHGLVTGISVHPLMHGKRHRLAISSGVDWSTKLWSFNLPITQIGETNAAAAAMVGKQSSSKLASKMLCDFRGPYEQVSDAEWSPAQPSLFATGNGAGQVSIYDISYSLEDPRLPPLNVSNSCLTKLRWSHDGRWIAAGDLDGQVRLISVSSDISEVKVDAMANFDKVVAKLL